MTARKGAPKKAAESESERLSGPGGTPVDPWKAALATFAKAQAAVDKANQTDRAPFPKRAAAYRVRAEAWMLLSKTAPLSTPVPLITATFVAAASDMEAAHEYERMAGESK